MFSKSSSNKTTATVSTTPSKPQAAATSTKAAAPSIISADLKLVGDLSSEGEIQIDGVIDGDVNAKVLLVGETASTKGEINCESVRVHGKVMGQIKAKAVYLSKTARVTGDILHESLTIETGAFLEGHCKRIGASGTSQLDSRINVINKDLEEAPPAPAGGSKSGSATAQAGRA